MTQEPRRLLDEPDLDLELRAWLSSQEPICPLAPSTRAAVGQRLAASIIAGVALPGGELWLDKAASLPPPGAAEPFVAASGTGTSAGTGVSVHAAASVPAATAPTAAVATTASGAIAAVGTAGAATASAILGAKALLVAAVVSAAGAGVWWGAATASQSSEPPLVSAPQESLPSPNAVTLRPSRGTAATAATPSAASVTTAGSAGAPVVGAAVPAAGATTPKGGSEVRRAGAVGAVEPASGEVASAALRREVRLLQQARALLSRDPKAASAVLKRYDAAFPNGELRSEADALQARIDQATE